MQPQNKGPGMLWGQSYVLPMTWGVEAYEGPLSVDMQPLRLFHLFVGLRYQRSEKLGCVKSFGNMLARL